MEPNAILGILVPVVMFVSYFWLRTRMIGMFSKLWKVSFVAGIISLFLSGFLMAILNVSRNLSETEGITLPSTRRGITPVFFYSSLIAPAG